MPWCQQCWTSNETITKAVGLFSEEYLCFGHAKENGYEMSESTMKPEPIKPIKTTIKPRDIAIKELMSADSDSQTALTKAVNMSGLTRKTVLKIRREIKAKLPINKDAFPKERIVTTPDPHIKQEPVFHVSHAQYLVTVIDEEKPNVYRVPSLEQAIERYNASANIDGVVGSYLSVILREFTK